MPKRTSRPLSPDAVLAVECEKLTPLSPANLQTPDGFLAPWRVKGREMFRRCRELVAKNDFVERVINLKLAFCNDAFGFVDPEAQALDAKMRKEGESQRKPSKLEAWLAKIDFDFPRVAEDAWLEFLTCDNVVAFWRSADSVPVDGLPAVTILNCEDVELLNVFGEESVKVWPKKVTLSKEQKAALPQRYAKAIETGGSFTLSADQGECWRVLKRAKSGGTLGEPRLGAIFDELSTRDLLELGDWAGAWTMKDVIRQIKKGHKIDSGPLAGDPKHFLKVPQQKRIMAQHKNKGGAFTVVTNFDISYAFPFLDPRFFDESKYNGVMSRLRAWAGAVEEMRETRNVSPYLLQMFEREGFYLRSKVAGLLESIFNSPDFYGKNEPPVPLRVKWNPHSFKTIKDLMEWVRLGSNGLVSPQTAREAMGVDDAIESARMLAAHKDRLAYSPPFEPRQGLSQGLANNGKGEGGKGGRPTEKPIEGTVTD